MIDFPVPPVEILPIPIVGILYSIESIIPRSNSKFRKEEYML